jgi:hypothetical protein
MKSPAVYILWSDMVNPRRLFILREDTRGLVHFALDEMSDSALAVPYCHAESHVRLVVFFRAKQEFFMPTCFWCLNEPYKKAKRP